MRSPTFITALVFSIALGASGTAFGQPAVPAGKSPSEYHIEDFLDRPDPEFLKDALDSAKRLPASGRPAVGKRLREAFERRWVTSDGTGAGLTTDQLTKLIETTGAQPFGADRSQLVGLLTGETLPAAWQNKDFLAWAR
jgi:hypothetical protein